MSKKKSHPEHLDVQATAAKDVTTQNAVAEEESTIAEGEIAEEEDRLNNMTAEELAAECSEAQRRAAENWEKLLRLQAEMENVRRRAERDVVSAHKYGVEKLIKNLLPVIDSLERGMEVAAEGSAEVKAMYEGMTLTHKLLLETLEKQGVKQLDPMGEPFNPEEMEAVSTQPGDEVEANTVLSVVQKGYLLNDRLVRPVMVVVSQ